MNHFIRLVLIVCGLIPNMIWAANDGNPDFFERVGKINVVVAVIALIFVGLAFFLYRMDRRITHLEQNDNQ